MEHGSENGKEPNGNPRKATFQPPNVTTVRQNDVAQWWHKPLGGEGGSVGGRVPGVPALDELDGAARDASGLVERGEGCQDPLHPLADGGWSIFFSGVSLHVPICKESPPTVGCLSWDPENLVEMCPCGKQNQQEMKAGKGERLH